MFGPDFKLAVVDKDIILSQETNFLSKYKSNKWLTPLIKNEALPFPHQRTKHMILDLSNPQHPAT